MILGGARKDRIHSFNSYFMVNGFPIKANLKIKPYKSSETFAVIYEFNNSKVNFRKDYSKNNLNPLRKDIAYLTSINTELSLDKDLRKLIDL